MIAYCMDWHLTSSDAFRALLVEPLADLGIELRAWDGTHLPAPLEPGEPTVFCMLPPPPGARGDLVWLPMWDQVRSFDDAWWAALPRGLRVVALSGEVDRRARAAGLPTLRLRYFADPDDVVPARWDDGRIVFHWNRTGLVSPRFLERLCRALGARELLFDDRVDPGVPETIAYELPAEVGGARVTRVAAGTREDFLRATERANVVLAPRVAEGVGMVFLEALARGCAVLAYDGPTMCEYVDSGANGLLLHNPRFARPAPHALSDRQPWRRIGSVDLAALGARARADHAAGRAAWEAALPRYRDFVLGA